MTAKLDDAAAQAHWDEAADAWDQFVQSGLDYYRTLLHGPALLAACGEVGGLDVLDLGAGQGWFSRQLAQRGARVLGAEWSPRLVAHAARHEAEAPLGARYEVLDAMKLAARFPPASFDLVTACMSIMDMPRPGQALAGARAVLRPGGRVVVSLPNPVTDSTYRQWARDTKGRKLALQIDRYFEAGTQVMDWSMKRLPTRFRTIQYRFTLEQWSRMIEEAGLFIARMREPRPSPEALRACPELADAGRVPYFLILELRAL